MSKRRFALNIVIVAHNKWKINAIYIKNAFLQEEETGRVIYVAPKEANTNNVWHLKKWPYSLVDASGKWYEKVKSVLISLNLSLSKYDPLILISQK